MTEQKTVNKKIGNRSKRRDQKEVCRTNPR